MSDNLIMNMEKYKYLLDEFHPIKNGDIDKYKLTYGCDKNIYWLCSEGHTWLCPVKRRTTKNQKCRKCKNIKNNKILLVEKYKNIADEIHPTKNGDIDINKLYCNETTMIVWICTKNRSHEYTMMIKQKIAMKDPCKVCRKIDSLKKKKKVQANSLRTKHPDIADEFHSTKNGYHTAETITCGSTLLMWWICQKCGNEWKQGVSKRLRVGKNCYNCRKKEKDYNNSLGKNCPHLLKEWDYTKNIDIDPFVISQNSGYRAFWICENGHPHRMPIKIKKNDLRNCPDCPKENKKLSEKYPNLLNELCYEEDKKILDNYTYGSNKKFTWKCDKEHTYEMAINCKTRGKGCPTCAGRIVDETNCLARHKDIASQFHPTLNGNITPNDVHERSNKKYYWICDVNKKHVWKSSVVHRVVRKSGCLYCAGLLTIYEESVAHDYSYLLDEFDKNAEINKDIDLGKLSKGSHVEVGWKCSDGHKWITKLYFRTLHKTGCPTCANSSYSKSAIEWIESIAEEKNIFIKHATNGGEHEIRINGKLTKVDGYYRRRRTVYEYNGCFTHSCRAINCPIGTRYDSDGIHQYQNITHQEVYEKTLAREQAIRDEGYKLVIKWECEYKHGIKRKFK